MSRTVEQKADDFTRDLQDTLTRVLGADAASQVVATLNLDGDKPRMHVRSDNAIPLLARKSEATVLLLEFEFWCADSSSSDYLTVQRSEVSVYPPSKPGPLFRLDADTRANAVPAAHWNVYAKRDDIVRAMLISGRYSGKKHAKSLRKSPSSAPGRLHFPVGGWRFRPCLEDVLEMLIAEFDLKREPSAMDVLSEKRGVWRSYQLAAAVWDNTEVAADALREVGYVVQAPDLVRPERTENTRTI